MRETSPGIRMIQNELDSLLQEVGEVLDAANCPYYLAYGTALGAVRHADHIPWDVDVDIHIHQADYDRALAALRSSPTADFELLTPGLKGYEQLFARVGRPGTHHTILRVDLFPLDPAPSGKRAQQAYIATMKLLAQVFMIRVMDVDERRHYSRRKRWIAQALKVGLAVVPPNLIMRAAATVRQIPGQGRRDEGLLVNSFGSYGSREFFDATWFEQAAIVPFRSRTAPVPTHVHAYLRQVYGKYEETPEPQAIEDMVEFAELHYVRPLVDMGFKVHGSQ